MIEIVPEIESRLAQSSNLEPIDPFEEMFFSATLGASLRHFEGYECRASVQFSADSQAGLRCMIEVETRVGSICLEGGGASRAAAFMQASESLERRVFDLVDGGSIPGASPERLAA